MLQPAPDRRFPYDPDEPFAPQYDRGHDRPQSFAGDATILPQRGFEAQPLLTIPSVPVGAKARKGIAFEPAGGQSLDPIARDTLLSAIARSREEIAIE